MTATTYIAQSITELLGVRARTTGKDAFVYTGDARDGNKVALRTLKYVFATTYTFPC